MSAGFKHTAARVITSNRHMAATAIKGLSTVVPNSKDHYENVWLPKNMHLEKQPFKNHNTKNQLQLYTLK